LKFPISLKAMISAIWKYQLLICSLCNPMSPLPQSSGSTGITVLLYMSWEKLFSISNDSIVQALTIPKTIYNPKNSAPIIHII